jgi:hypothetical protein
VFKDNFCEPNRAGGAGRQIRLRFVRPNVEATEPGANGLIAYPTSTAACSRITNPNAARIFFGADWTRKSTFSARHFESIAFLLGETSS